MKRRLISTTILLLLMAVIVFGIITPSFAQGDKEREFYYYARGEKIYIEVSQEWIAVAFADRNMALDAKLVTLRDIPNLGDLSLMRLLGPSSFVDLIPLKKGLELKQVLEIIQAIRSLPKISWVNPAIQFEGAPKEYYCTYRNSITIIFAETVTAKKRVEEKNFIAQAFDVDLTEVNTRIPNGFRLQLSPTSQYDAMELANLYYETGRAPIATPDIDCPPIRFTSMNDTFRAVQWDLDPNPGIDVVNAHNITTGSGSVIIGVLDDAGFDLNHEEFEGKISAPYDFKDNDSTPEPNSPSDPYRFHGTAVMSSALATSYNYKGMGSACHGCRVMPLKVPGLLELPGAIDFAKYSGARIVVMSFGFPSSTKYDPLELAISQASGYGTGVVIVAGVGNDNHEGIAYPANLDDFVLAVGGSDISGSRWVSPPGGSNWGPQLDVVAPASGLVAAHISGTGGSIYPQSDYLVDLNGLGWWGATSGATPQVAGVAGLMLSVAPHLTDEQVRQIIKDTANAGTHTDIGAGIVDAAAAVGLALDTAPISDYTMPNDKFVTPLLILPQFPFISTQSSALALDDSDNLPASCAPQGYKQSPMGN